MAAPSDQAPLEVHTDFMDLCETTLGLFAARPTWDVLVPALDPRQLEQTIGADLNGDDPVGSWGEADPSQPDDDVYNDEQWNNWYAAPQTPPTDPPPSEMKSDMAPPLTASGGSFAGNKKPLTATEVMEEYVAGLAAKHMPSSVRHSPHLVRHRPHSHPLAGHSPHLVWHSRHSHGHSHPLVGHSLVRHRHPLVRHSRMTIACGGLTAMLTRIGSRDQQHGAQMQRSGHHEAATLRARHGGRQNMARRSRCLFFRVSEFQS